ncbi:MAG: Methyltransferase [Mycobacterium sp.]|jgi:ubiquinone/menaquinone biosynthesis C-methylase UbiE|nr:Methyltransferase [Mycobacterium sp.]
MSSRQRLFGLLYRFGFTPWDGHPMSPTLTALVEGDSALEVGSALDVGCGTGDNSVYLAKHGWHVTGVDYVSKPLEAARAKARAAGVTVEFRQADATELESAGVGTGFTLIVDSGCLHGMSAQDRDAYVRGVSSVIAPGGLLLIVAFTPGGSFGVPGISPDEVARRFDDGWTAVASGPETELAGPARHYSFRRDG